MQISDKFLENTLVRYRAVTENNMDALKNDRLYYSTPNNFNDPYDTLIFANYEKVAQDIYNNMEEGMDEYLEYLKENKDIPNAFFLYGIGYASWNGSKKEQILKNYARKIYDTVKEVKDDLRKNVKIICFTEDCLSKLMWSHYADSHKGYALIYDKDEIKMAENYTYDGKLIRKKPLLKQVIYVKTRSDLTNEVEDYVRAYRMQTLGDVEPPISNLSQEKLRKMVIEKSLEWSYEKEWRVIPKHIDLEQESSLGYMSIRPKGAIIGSNCSEENCLKIINICKEKEIPVSKVDLNYWEPGWELELAPWSKKELNFSRA